jgi:hypothetical protein
MRLTTLIAIVICSAISCSGYPCDGVSAAASGCFMQAYLASMPSRNSTPEGDQARSSALFGACIVVYRDQANKCRRCRESLNGDLFGCESEQHKKNK